MLTTEYEYQGGLPAAERDSGGLGAMLAKFSNPMARTELLSVMTSAPRVKRHNTSAWITGAIRNDEYSKILAPLNKIRLQHSIDGPAVANTAKRAEAITRYLSTKMEEEGISHRMSSSSAGISAASAGADLSADSGVGLGMSYRAPKSSVGMSTAGADGEASDRAGVGLSSRTYLDTSTVASGDGGGSSSAMPDSSADIIILRTDELNRILESTGNIKLGWNRNVIDGNTYITLDGVGRIEAIRKAVKTLGLDIDRVFVVAYAVRLTDPEWCELYKTSLYFRNRAGEQLAVPAHDLYSMSGPARLLLGTIENKIKHGVFSMKCLEGARADRRIPTNRDRLPIKPTKTSCLSRKPSYSALKGGGKRA